MITTNENYNIEEIIPKLKAYTTGNVVDKVTCEEKRVLSGAGKRVALMDFGAKNNIAQSLNNRGCEVTIYPAHTTAEEILSTNPDGIMLSNGPGDPKECTDIIKEIRKLYDSDTPIFAICLGHQLMALATGRAAKRRRSQRRINVRRYVSGIGRFKPQPPVLKGFTGFTAGPGGLRLTVWCRRAISKKSPVYPGIFFAAPANAASAFVFWFKAGF